MVAIMFHVKLCFFLICIFNFCATVRPIYIVTSLKIYIFRAQLHYLVFSAACVSEI